MTTRSRVAAKKNITERQRAAARRNAKEAATAAKQKKTVAHLPKTARTALGKEGAEAAAMKRSR